MTTTSAKLIAAILTGCLVNCFVGCTSFGPIASMKLPFTGKKESICEKPTRIAVTWSPDVLVQPGRTPTRGFGGRLFFFDETGKPVRVDGNLMVHAFRGDGTTPGQVAKRYGYTPEQFKNHLGSSELGDSYSIWIPWDAAGGEQEKITLIATFTPSGGQAIQSGASIALLPGQTNNLTHQARLAHRSSGSIAPASHAAQLPSYSGSIDQPVPADRPGMRRPGLGLSTTTIQLPGSTQQLLQQAAEAPRVSTRPRPMPPIDEPPVRR